MIRHIVLLPFKESVSPKERLSILEELGKLKETIPEIHSFSSGKNNSPEGLSRGYEHGFVMEFKNTEDRSVYLKHPSHTKLAKEKVIPALKDGKNSPVVFDYEL